MKKTAEQIQVLYEIAMSIGKSLDLHDMLKQALSTYLRKLNCTSGIVYRTSRTPNNEYINEQIYALPRTLDVSKKFPELLDIFPEKNTKLIHQERITKAPLLFLSKSNLHLHIMLLGEFGFIVLVKSKTQINEYLLKELREINEKLGQACFSCINNESLKEREKRYKDLSELMPGMVCETDTNGFVTFVNKYAVNKFGYDISDLDKGFHVSKIFAKEDQKRAIKNFKRSLTDKNMPHREYNVAKANGEKFPVLLYSSQLMSGGKVKGIIGVMIDITDRKENENKLKEYAESLELALKASNAGLWSYNFKTDRFMLNDEWYEEKGIDVKNQTPNISFLQKIIHLEDQERVSKAIQEHLEGKSPYYQVEFRSETKKGKYTWVLDTGKITEYDESGKPIKMVGTSIDITSKKENELILQQNLIQQELLSEIALNLNSLDNFDSRINFTLEKTGKHSNVSRVYIFEDNKGGLTTSNTFEWCNKDITPQIDELQNISYREVIPSWKKILNEKGKIYSENIKNLPKDIIEILEPQEIKSILVYPLFVKGNFFGFIGFDECTRTKHWSKLELELLRTISGIIANAYERKFSEESLKESELTNRAIIAALPDMLFHFNKSGKLLNYNFLQGYITIFNEVRINKGISNIFPKNLSKQLKSAINNCIENEQYNFEFELQLENGHAFFEARTSKINNEQVIVLMRDITKNKLNETKLTIEKDKAEQANQAKSEFLANMSHEIRTPMNAILGFSEALYNKITHPEHKETLKSIVNSGTLLLSLLNDILDLSKIEAGKLEFYPQPIDLANLLQEIIVLFSEKAEKKDIKLGLVIDASFPKSLIIDEIRIKQVIFNIIGNAIKFTKQGYVKVLLNFENKTEKKGKLIISVEDSGIGIPESQYNRIFDAFTQQSGQSNREFEGVGLGLSISKKLIEKMSGSITVSSKVGSGSTFKILIPDTEISETSATLKKIKKEHEIIFTKSKILVVDDVSSNIKMMQYLLTSWGLEFVSAENGQKALEILEQTHPDVILLDIRMPVMDGFEVAKKIKTKIETSSIPVIACTANVSQRDKIKYTEDFDGIIYKPIKPDELKKILKKYLKHEKIQKEQKTRNDKSVSLNEVPEEILAKLPDIYKILSQDFLPIWKKISGSLILFQIEDFAIEMKKVLKPYKFGFINAYANDLLDDVSHIRLDSLKENLKKFPELLEQINKKIN